MLLICQSSQEILAQTNKLAGVDHKSQDDGEPFQERPLPATGCGFICICRS